jgi:hypothetical protein
MKKPLPQNYKSYLEKRLNSSVDPKAGASGMSTVDESDEFDDMYPDGHPASGEDMALDSAYEEIDEPKEEIMGSFAKALKMAKRFKF